MQILNVDQLITALGWTMLHSFWQAALIALLLALILRHPAIQQANTRYIAGNAALLLLLMGAVLTFSLVYTSSAPEAELSFALSAGATETGAIAPSAMEGSLASWYKWLNSQLPTMVTLWLIGFVVFALRFMGGLAYLQYLKHYHSRPLRGEWSVRLTRLKKEIAIKEDVRLCESKKITVPMVIGLFKPVILLPVGTVNQLSPAQVEAILAHELAHVRRKDFLLNLVQSLMETLFYFNPAVWWISSQIRLERENSCDDLAIRSCTDALEYARALMLVRERELQAPALALSLGRNRHQLLYRIKRILGQPHEPNRLLEKGSTTLLLLLAGLMLSFGANHSLGNLLGRTNTLEPADQVVYEVLVGPDTLPKPERKHTRMKLSKKEDGSTYEMTVENGEIIRLSIDGKEIPSESFGKYEDITRQLIREMEVPEPPAPPAPPQPDVVPAAPTPPTPPRKVEMDVRVESDDAGKTMVFITRNQEGKNDTLLLDEEVDHMIFRSEEDVETVVIRKKGKSGDLEHEIREAMILLEKEDAEEVRMRFEEEIARLEAEKARLKGDERQKLEKRIQEMERKLKEEKEIRIQKEIRFTEARKELIKDKERLEKEIHGQTPMPEPKIFEYLRKDGLYPEGEALDLEINNKWMRINGKKQSRSTHKKYLKILEELHGGEWGPNSRYEIQLVN